ncbi:hypothetical protein QTP88_014847 [Uroleucon formosanum]
MSDGELDEGYSVSQSSSTSSSLTTLPTPSLPRSIDVAEQLKTKISQENFETEMINFFLHSMIPLRCVEDPYFLKMFDALNISDCGLRVLSRRSFCRKIDNFYEKNKNEIKEELNDDQFVCTTVDIWSGKKRSFLGVTCHWISINNLNRISKALACRRFKGSHTYDKISDLINEINSEFNLSPTKIVATITDNGSNFVKAFKMFGVKLQNINIVEDLHIWSITITLNINKVIKTSVELSLIHDQVIKKCNILWKLAGRPKSAEVIQNVLGHILSRPGETRWNSLYDSLRQILRIKNTILNLNRTLEINNKNCLREQNFNYIEEHLKCTTPISEALDIMQVNALLESIEKRFGNYLNFTSPESLNAAIAALSYPHFKKRWLTCVETEFHDRLNFPKHSR